MKTSTRISEMQKFHFGREVVCSDGEAGSLTHVIFEYITCHPLHIDLKGITIRVLDSFLYLNGNISSQLRADIVEDQVRGIPGLLEIKNNLIGDDQLAADLARVLALDSRTNGLPIGIYPRLGEVRLSGAVHTLEQKAVVEEVVRDFPGVRSVINDLVVDPKAQLLPVLMSTGIEAEDKVPGKYIRRTK